MPEQFLTALQIRVEPGEQPLQALDVTTGDHGSGVREHAQRGEGVTGEVDAVEVDADAGVGAGQGTGHGAQHLGAAEARDTDDVQVSEFGEVQPDRQLRLSLGDVRQGPGDRGQVGAAGLVRLGQVVDQDLPAERGQPGAGLWHAVGEPSRLGQGLHQGVEVGGGFIGHRVRRVRVLLPLGGSGPGDGMVRGREVMGLAPPPLSRHLVCTGNPGTDRTTVARLYGRTLAAVGLLERGHLVEADRSALVGEYAGHTGPRTTRVRPLLAIRTAVSQRPTAVSERPTAMSEHRRLRASGRRAQPAQPCFRSTEDTSGAW